MRDHERLKFYSACRCYRERDKRTPSSTDANTITWGSWFEARYNETLDAYFVRAKAEKLVQQIVKFEEQAFGDSLAKKCAEDVRELMRAERAKRMKKGGNRP